ncbi:hypothetical protein PY250_17160 [Vibrio alginolyticus]|uniref:hypothetical protein n=1 Tax=Vibrio alginolyticus TaxID=663 RepID=UPI0023D8677D|nr:hypothetical protein [Vibrio alginolyticus]ELA6598529.1 hypothetical protein [Vibrio alginolyticus]WEK81274.1 hypothetical protein PY250_17160 [Vibrio alginolyticus]
MKNLCPKCRTEMIERSNVYVCPRNDIGDCTYDAFELADDDNPYTFSQEHVSSDLRSYAVADSK